MLIEKEHIVLSIPILIEICLRVQRLSNEEAGPIAVCLDRAAPYWQVEIYELPGRWF